MKKYNKRKKLKETKKHVPEKSFSSIEQEHSKKKIIYGIIFILTFILYANTIMHDFVLDDKMVITGNRFVLKGISGIKDILIYDSLRGYLGHAEKYLVGGRYRPLSLVTFAIEYEIFGQNPHFSHFINILLYALTGILIFKVLSRLLVKYKTTKWYFSIPFLTTILFIAHPIHTEVVANIKSRDEIMALLGALLTLWFTLEYLDYKKSKYLIFSTITFFLGALSKENTITFIAIIPITIYFFTHHSIKKNFTAFIPILLSTFIFLIIRQSVLVRPPKIVDELLNNPFLHASFYEKYATIFYTLGIYLKLLFFPHPLTYDYYPYHIPIINWSNIRAIVPFIVYIGLGIYALIGYKKRTVISYGIWFYLITLSVVSNFFFPIGTFMAERFVYMSSFGFCLIISYILVQKAPLFVKKERLYLSLLSLILIIVLSLYSIKTISRNSVWKDNFTLTTTDIKICYNSAKANSAAADFLIVEAKKIRNQEEKTEYIDRALKYLHKAIEIHPRYERALAILADTYNHHIKDYDRAIYFYEQVFDINRNRKNVAYNLGTLYLQHRKHDLDKAIFYLEEATKVNPRHFGAYKNLGVAYYYKSDFVKASQEFEKAIKLNPKDKNLLMNLGLSYQQIGENEKAKYYFDKAKNLNE